MTKIRNKREIIENGLTPLDRKVRALTLRSLEAAMDAVNPKQLLESKLSLEKTVLKINEFSIDLKKVKDVYVVGGGKAGGTMSEAVERRIGKYINRGIVNVPSDTAQNTEIIKLNPASHPIPDEKGVKGTYQMLNIAEQAGKEDLIIFLISGGGSSLLPQPRGEITLEDKRKITSTLLKCGARINEVNTVRKHISEFKGGWFAEKVYPAMILNIVLSDVAGDALDIIASGPTVPDPTTFDDAVKVLKKYCLWNDTPKSIREVLSEGKKGRIAETPKLNNKTFRRVHTVVIGNNRLASLAACRNLESSGLNTLLLTSTLEGEARNIGVMLASIAQEIVTSGNPILKPAGIVTGGETTVKVTGGGLGGRNQEVALAAAQKIEDIQGVAVASLNTDGLDGPTDAAGAIVDGETMYRAKKKGMIPREFLTENDAYHFFSPLDDLILTGSTQTNVNDISILVAYNH